jgi:hypothetical protein
MCNKRYILVMHIKHIKVTRQTFSIHIIYKIINIYIQNILDGNQFGLFCILYFIYDGGA